ncbi:reverse transcriptase domain-containing protein [Tanacetum coccineum]
MLEEVKSCLCKCFSIKDLEEAAYILRIKIIHDRFKWLIALSQSAYLEKSLKKFIIENSKKGYTPMMEKPDYRKSQGAKTPTEVQRMLIFPYDSTIGSIMYAVRCTRPDVAFAQNLCSCFQQNPVMDWKSAKQSTTAMSSTEAEYIAAAKASIEAVWMRKFIDGLGGVMPSNKRFMEMLCDNEPALAKANDPGILKGDRHFQRKYHFIREVIQIGKIVLKKVHTDDNVADRFTKPVPFNKHFKHAMAIGIVPASSLIDAHQKSRSPSSNLIAESSTTPKRRNRRRFKQRVEPFSLEETSVVTMADQRTMAELLQAPTEGYGDAIVTPAILAENFELKHGLLNLRNQNYQAPPQNGPSNNLSSYMKANDVNMRVMQNQITSMRSELKKEMDTTLTRHNNAFKNELRNELTNDIKNMMSSFFQMNTASSSGSGSLPSNTVANPRGDLKAITTRSGISYDGPPIPPPFSPLLKVVEWEPKVTKDTVQPIGKFHFPADFVVVDYVVDPRVPLILGRYFLRTARALIDVYGDELTLRVDDEAITFKTLFEDGDDFILDEIEACLTNDSIPPGIIDADFDPEGELLLLEKLLNDDPSSPLPPKELPFVEIKMIKSFIDDPPELELKDLPSHLEYTFLEGTDKLPVIISKKLKDKEKAALLKILMEDDFKPAVEHQRRVNPKIHKVIKKEVIKLLDAELIYLISNSLWVSPVHYVPKKGCMTVVENEDNE